MKLLVRSLFLYLLLLSIFCFTEISVGTSDLFSGQVVIHEDGLSECAQVLTTSGKKSIRELSEQDVLIDHRYQEQHITSITKTFVHRFVNLVLADEVIQAGCTQQFCIGSCGTWIAANELQAGDVLVSASGHDVMILEAEIIDEDTMLYALTVDDHVFCVAQHDLIVHNAAAVFGLQSICLGTISISNPVIAAIGATVALSMVANQALQTWRNQQHSNVASPPESVMVAERLYYESRKQDLEKLKIELVRIKQDIETIKSLCNPNAASFTYQFLNKARFNQHNAPHPWLTIAKDKELQLTKAQQQELRLLRQRDLLVREHELIELQAALAVHSNELIAQVDLFCAEYRATLVTLNATYEHFQRGYLDATATGQLYACLITQEHMLDRLRRKIQEICIIGDYYQRLSRTSGCIASSTSIIAQWEQVLPCVRLNTKWIDQDKKTCAQRMTCVEDYFRRCSGSSISTFKNNLTKTVERHLGSCDATSLAVAVNKLEAVTKEAKVTVQIPINVNDIDNDETDKVEDKDLLKRLLEKRKSNGSIDLGDDPKDPRKKWWERLMEIMDEFFVKDNNKMEHIIRKIKHGFHDLLKGRGFDKNINKVEWEKAESKLAREIQEKYVKQGNFPNQESSNVFKREIDIDGYKVTIEGVMHQWLPRIGTAYIAAFREIYKHLM